MDFLKAHILTFVTFVPLVGALLLMMFPRDEHGQIRVTALITSLLGFALSIPLAFWHDPGATGFQLEERVSWIAGLGISYHVGVDGIAVILILLTTFLSPIVILSTFGSIHTRVKELMIALLVLQTAMVGTFAALDLVLFFVFWELMLVPMYLLIGIWGSEQRIYAAVKFFLFTSVGSLLMFAAILFLYWQSAAQGTASFDYHDLLALDLSATQQAWLFGAFALAFAIKVPIFPVHTWLPDAHTQAPAAGSVVLAGVLLKMGTFGFVRYAMPLFPQALETYAPLIGWLAVVGIVYGSLMSMAQTDMKKLIAYSSVAHLGFVMVGLMARTPESVGGAVLQMVNHGISTGALFLLIGYMYDRRHTREISAYGGQAKVTPVFAFIFLVVTLSSIGLPSTNGFVGEFLILTGTYASPSPWGRAWGVVGATGVILGAVYMLSLFQKLYLGPVTNPEVAATKDLRAHELATLVPLLALIVIIGVYPQPFLKLVSQPVDNLIARVSPGQGPTAPTANSFRPRPSRGAGLERRAPGPFGVAGDKLRFALPEGPAKRALQKRAQAGAD